MTDPILVTGGTGKLGRVLVGKLAEGGHDVRLLSRRTAPADHGPATWYTGDLREGTGVEHAVSGAGTVIHCATRLGRGDINDTARLIDAAKAAGTSHLVYISIVGVDRIPMFYYRAKLECERLIAESGLGYTVMRATQFHDLLASMFSAELWLPAMPLPKGVRFQPIDVTDVAARLARIAGEKPAGRADDLGGPQVRTTEDLARDYLRARNRKRPVLRSPMPGNMVRELRAGANLAPEHAEGVVTFDEFLSHQK